MFTNTQLDKLSNLYKYASMEPTNDYRSTYTTNFDYLRELIEGQRLEKLADAGKNNSTNHTNGNGRKVGRPNSSGGTTSSASEAKGGTTSSASEAKGGTTSSASEAKGGTAPSAGQGGAATGEANGGANPPTNTQAQYDSAAAKPYDIETHAPVNRHGEGALADAKARLGARVGNAEDQAWVNHVENQRLANETFNKNIEEHKRNAAVAAGGLKADAEADLYAQSYGLKDRDELAEVSNRYKPQAPEQKSWAERNPMTAGAMAVGGLYAGKKIFFDDDDDKNRGYRQ